MHRKDAKNAKGNDRASRPLRCNLIKAGIPGLMNIFSLRPPRLCGEFFKNTQLPAPSGPIRSSPFM
jgi:hypothetical protein